MLGKYGVDPLLYWKYTLKELDFIAKSFEHKNSLDWERTRNIELATYSSVITMNGKQAFKLKKPSDLYALPTDAIKVNKTIKIDKDKQQIAVDRTKQSKNYNEWLKKT